MRAINGVLGLSVALIFSVFSLVSNTAIANAFAGQTTRVSVSSAGDPARAVLPSDTVSAGGVISADGRYVVFWSSVANLVRGVSGGQVYRHDLRTGETVLVSATTARAGGNNISRDPSISEHGNFVVFSSTATDLVARDMNGALSDVYVRDMDRDPALGGAITLVSENSAGEQGNLSSVLSGLSGAREISDDGRYVVFMSVATNFDAVNNGVRQIYRKDMTSGATPPTPGALLRVSVNDAGEPADQLSQAPSISGTGDTVAFQSTARNLSRSSTNGLSQVFARELLRGLTTLESLGAAATNRPSTTPVLSSTGQYLAFESAGVLDVNDLDDGTLDVYLRDRGLNTTVLASRSPNAVPGATSFGPSISGDGRWVAYSSIDEKVFGSEPRNDTNGIVADVFIYDRDSDRANPSLRYVSLNDAGEQARTPSFGASVSGDGHFVLFASAAPNLVPVPASSGSQLYVRNLLSNQPPVVDAGPDETVAEGDRLMRTGSFSDLDASTTWSATADVGAGTFSITVSPATKQWTLSHEPLAVGTHLVTVSVTDGEGATGSDSFLHTVTNVAPSVNLGAEAFVDFGAALLRRAVLSDPGSDSPVPQPAETYSATVDYGDGTGVTDLVLDGNRFWLDHTYAKPGTYVVVVNASDSNGGAGSGRLTVHVVNHSPVVDAGRDETVAEGDWLMRTGSFSDRDASTTWSATADLGAGAFPIRVNPTTKQWTLSHEPLAVGTYVVTISVTDGERATGSDTFLHTVTNVEPSVNLGAEAFVYFGSTLHRRGGFSDPGSNLPVPQPAETYSATVDYGDGTGLAALVLDGNRFWLDHTYANDGTYVVRVTVSDSNGGAGSARLTVHVFDNSFQWVGPLGDKFVVGRNLPVKFTVRGPDGSFIVDRSVQVDVIDAEGNVMVGPYMFGDQPSRSVTVSGDSYHVNVDTKDLEAGMYTLRVRFSSPTLSGEFTLSTNGTANALRLRLRD